MSYAETAVGWVSPPSARAAGRETPCWSRCSVGTSRPEAPSRKTRRDMSTTETPPRPAVPAKAPAPEPQESPAARFQHVLVVGAGQMGSGIAQVVAASGRQVSLHDPYPGALERGLQTMRKSLERIA